MAEITAVRIVEGRIVELTFADGSIRVVDLTPFLRGPAFAELPEMTKSWPRSQLIRSSGPLAGRTVSTLIPTCCMATSTPRGHRNNSPTKYFTQQNPTRCRP